MGNITVLCYVYRDDAEIAKVSLAQAKKLLPDATVIAIDDGHRPMLRKDAQAFADIGIPVIYSSHNRNGNLIGPSSYPIVISKDMII